jgi:hypothetical protein
MRNHLLPKFTTVTVAICALAVFSPQAKSDDAFLSTADAFIDSLHPDNNYGAAGALAVSASGSPNGEFDTFISFSITPGYSSIQSISIQLTDDGPLNPIFNPSMAGQFTIEYIPDNTWVEGVGTPRSSDTNPAHINFTNHATHITGAESLGTFAYDGSTSDSSQPTYTLTPTADFLAAVKAGGTVSLYVTAADSSVSYIFDSLDNEAANGLPANGDMISVQPVLLVNGQAIPEPSAFCALAAGAAFFAGFRRHRHCR